MDVWACRALVFCLAVLSGQFADAQTLRDALTELAERQGFSMTGLSNVGVEASKRVTGSTKEQLSKLLRAYNHVVVERTDGGVQALLIMSLKTERPVEPIGAALSEPSTLHVIVTKRRGTQHVVEATLQGPLTFRQTLPLVVDTGASLVVLPNSLIRPLGFSDTDLSDAEVQTANGKIAVRVGVLKSVRIGNAVVEDVSVSFVPDAGLGGNNLLGMSFLSKFEVTLDDKANEIVLIERDR